MFHIAFGNIAIFGAILAGIGLALGLQDAAYFIPTVLVPLLGRLAVANDLRGKGLGGKLLMDALY
jgi:hypothetical protein